MLYEYTKIFLNTNIKGISSNGRATVLHTEG
jgi:hypothetical protein